MEMESNKKTIYLFESRFNSIEEALEELIKINKKIIVMSADISSRIAPKFVVNNPDRFFNFGIAEQNMFSAAAGFAITGLTPIVMTLSVFVSMRACEQVRTDISYPKLNVVIIATGGGMSYGTLGATHMGIEDISILRSIPNMTIIIPADYTEAKYMIKEAINIKGPVYIRFGRKENPEVYRNNPPNKFIIGKAVKLREGADISLISCGNMVNKALEASNKLEGLGISVSVYDFHTIKPLDEKSALEASMSRFGIITIEDNNFFGGLGSAVAEFLSANKPTPIKRIGIPDVYPVIGGQEDLYKEYRMDTDSIIQMAVEMIKKIKRNY